LSRFYGLVEDTGDLIGDAMAKNLPIGFQVA
jgi:hypothetical protein